MIATLAGLAVGAAVIAVMAWGAGGRPCEAAAISYAVPVKAVVLGAIT